MLLLRLILNNGDSVVTTLDQLLPGQFGQIVRIDGFDSIASRLREMGFIPGQSVQFVRTAPLGDPMKCSVQGSRIAVRSGEARRVYIEPILKPSVEPRS